MMFFGDIRVILLTNAHLFSFRQLLAGVDNLKLLARRVEGMESGEPDPIDDYNSSDLDEEDFLGGGGQRAL